MAASQIIYHDKFDSTGFTNENTLARAMLSRPDVINPVITHLAGREDKKFPLTFMTEGQKGGYKTIELNDIQYEWGTMSRMKNSSVVYSTTYGAGDKPGLGGTPFYVTFEDNWLKVQHTVMSRNGVQARVMERGKPVGSGRYILTLELIGAGPSDYCPLSELQNGSGWAMIGGASVSESFSMGNESNVQTPGKMKNQISILRKSYKYGGNIANKTVEIKLPTEGGGTTSYWMPFEEWQHMMQWKQVCEESYWYSKYNRNADGTITMNDYDSGLPIPIGAGIIDQIPNKDTYSKLTYQKIKETVGDVMYGATDTGKMDVVLYTGKAGMEEFSEAMLNKASGFTQVMGDKFVRGEGRNLYLSGFFTAFEHIDGHVVTVQHLPLLDKGSYADVAPKHPVTGRPLSSYEMYFLDQSTYDGAPNVQMVSQRGRSMKRGIIKGMAPTGAKADGSDFSGNDIISTEKDENSVHFLSAKGVCVRRNTHCFKLSCNLS